MIVQVTEAHIKKGRKGNCYSCPIAMALKEARPEVNWLVDLFHVHYNADLRRTYTKLPEEAIAFIQRFDQKLDVQPFTFELELGI